MNSKLALECLAIGSLPHDNLESAMELVKRNFKNIPFWPQLVKFNKREDMIIQFLEKMPSLFYDDEKIYLDTDNEKFFEDLEIFYNDYEQIIQNPFSDVIDKYAINNSVAFNEFINIVRDLKPEFAKGQIVGPFTLSTSLTDKYGKCAFYDETLKEIITKTLIIKALWQIKLIKKASANTTPIIFIDEPSISQIGTSAYLSVTENEITEIIKEVSDTIKMHGAMSGIHCCGKCNWSIGIKAGVNIINFDAYNYAENLSLYSNHLKDFLFNDGYIAWGVIPTLDSNALENMDINAAISVFEKAVKYLTKKGINENIILRHSLFSPSCGAGSLSIELAEKAMNLTREISDNRKALWHLS